MAISSATALPSGTVGQASVQQLQSLEKVSVIFERTITDDGADYHAYLNSANQQGVGDITLSRIPKSYARYNQYGSETKVGKICIEFLVSHQRTVYSGVGSRLIQVAIEESLHAGEEYGGRVILKAGVGSHVFYYKQGFRCQDPSLDNVIETTIRNAKRKNVSSPATSLGQTVMYLPPSSIELWKKIIWQEPILEETKKKPPFTLDESDLASTTLLYSQLRPEDKPDAAWWWCSIV